MKRIGLGALALVLALAGFATACGDDDPPRDLDAYVCGDAQRDEGDREDDPRDVANAACLEVWDETDADDDDPGECLVRFQDGQRTRCGDTDEDDD